MTLSLGSNRLLTSGDMSADITSDAINLVNKEGFSIQAVFTGSPVGTLWVQGSVDGVTYTSMPSTELAIAAAGDVLYNFRDVNYSWARLFYDFTSGTGTLNAYYATKEDE